MLKPAILYKERLQKEFQKQFYSMNMLYETGCMDNWCPEIAENPDASTYQYAVVDKADNLVGFVAFKVEWYESCAYNFGILSFDPGNIINGFAMKEVTDMIINQWHLHRMEWRMVGGNPVEKSYDKFCNQYHGTKHILKDVIRDREGKYHDNIIYEIIF